MKYLVLILPFLFLCCEDTEYQKTTQLCTCKEVVNTYNPRTHSNINKDSFLLNLTHCEELNRFYKSADSSYTLICIPAN